MKPKPFKKGDLAVCITDHYSSIARGESFRVKNCRPCKCAREEWVIEFNHPRYGHGSYMADNFIKECPRTCKLDCCITNQYGKVKEMKTVENQYQDQNYYVIFRLQEDVPNLALHSNPSDRFMWHGDDEVEGQKVLKSLVRTQPEHRFGLFECRVSAEKDEPPVKMTYYLQRPM